MMKILQMIGGRIGTSRDATHGVSTITNPIRNRTALYTVITSGYDRPPVYPHYDADIDYYLVHDGSLSGMVQPPWKEIVALDGTIGERAAALVNRMLKWFIPQELNHYDQVIYVDGNLLQKKSLMDFGMGTKYEADIVLPLHPERWCVWQEMDACANLGKLTAGAHARAWKWLKEIKMPENKGLTTNCFMVRDPHAWMTWTQRQTMLKQSLLDICHRDQIIFPAVEHFYPLRKRTFAYSKLLEYFDRVKHVPVKSSPQPPPKGETHRNENR